MVMDIHSTLYEYVFLMYGNAFFILIVYTVRPLYSNRCVRISI